MKRFKIALDLATRVGLEDVAKLKWGVVILELGLETSRVYHIRGRPQLRNNIAGEKGVIFSLEMLRIGRPFKEDSQRIACSGVPECKPLFEAGCWVRYDASIACDHFLPCTIWEGGTG